MSAIPRRLLGGTDLSPLLDNPGRCVHACPFFAARTLKSAPADLFSAYHLKTGPVGDDDERFAMTKKEALDRLSVLPSHQGAEYNLEDLSSAELEEFVLQSELFDRATAQCVVEVRERHATLIRARQMNSSFELIDPPKL